MNSVILHSLINNVSALKVVKLESKESSRARGRTRSPLKTPGAEDDTPIPISPSSSMHDIPQSIYVYRINSKRLIRSPRYFFPNNFTSFTLGTIRQRFASDYMWNEGEPIVWAIPGGHSSDLDTEIVVGNLELNLNSTRTSTTILEIIGKENEVVRININYSSDHQEYKLTSANRDL